MSEGRWREKDEDREECTWIIIKVHMSMCLFSVAPPILQGYPELDLDDIMVIDESEREPKLKVSESTTKSIALLIIMTSFDLFLYRSTSKMPKDHVRYELCYVMFRLSQ